MKLKTHDKHEKSRIEIIGLNKGISRKIEENQHLKSEHDRMKDETEQQRNKLVEQENQLKRLKNAQTNLEKLLLKEESLSSLVQQIIEAETTERERQFQITKQLNQLAKMLDIKTDIPINDYRQTAQKLREEVSRLNEIINTDSDRNNCNICQEKVTWSD